MKGFVKDIEGLAIKNDEFRRVLYTAKHCQLVVMSLKPKEEIGAEVHKLDQFFRVEKGTSKYNVDRLGAPIKEIPDESHRTPPRGKLTKEDSL